MISIGYVVGTGFATVFLIALAIVANRLGAYRRRELAKDARADDRGYSFRVSDAGLARGFFWATIGATVVPIAIWTGTTWPSFDMDYHRYDTEKGTVESIDKRLVSDGESGMSEKYVVRFEDRSDQLGCLDTRCADVKKGDSLELACIKVWQWYGTPGHDCEFVSTDKN